MQQALDAYAAIAPVAVGRFPVGGERHAAAVAEKRLVVRYPVEVLTTTSMRRLVRSRL